MVNNIENINLDNINIENENQNFQPTQLEMREILIAKIKKYNNVDIKSKEVTNNVGQFYAITAHIKLADVGNCVFHSATLKTVSYNKRIVNIKCVFTDNENLKQDMKINRDSVFQCFRDIAPDTITSISLEDFKDQSEKSHLRIIASTIKGASLIFVYKRLMEFVKIINEKYGDLVNTPLPYIDDAKPVPIIPKPMNIQNTVSVSIPIQNNISTPIQNIELMPNTLLNNNINFIMSENIIKDLDKEEKRLQIIIDNIKLLKQTQLNYISNSNNINVTVRNNVPINNVNVISTPINIENVENVEHNNIVSPPTFASKVKQSIKCLEKN